MSFQSELIFEYSKETLSHPFETNAIKLIDKLMENGWDLGVEKKLFLLDIGEDFNFITLDTTLTNLWFAYNLIREKEKNGEMIRVSLEKLDIRKNIDIHFYEKKEPYIRVVLNENDNDLVISDPFKEISIYMKNIYKPIIEWAPIINVKYISGYDYKVIKEITGSDIKKQIESSFFLH